MLPAWLESLATPCPWHLRRMGYLAELLGIKSRHARCLRAWAPHLIRTRNVLLQAIAQCASRRKAVILGSGMLLDIPLDVLAGAFHEVVLVDLIHPLHTRRHRPPNVTLLTADISGVVEDVYRVADDSAATLPRASPTWFHADPQVDLVASVNLLSQLPYLPVEYLYREEAHTKEAIEAFARDVVLAHLEYLRTFPCVVALIADLERIKLDGDGNVLERLTALRGVRVPWRGEEWLWDLAPRPEADRHYGYQRRVIGIPNLHTAQRVD
jgi:hypothetical protein